MLQGVSVKLITFVHTLRKFLATLQLACPVQGLTWTFLYHSAMHAVTIAPLQRHEKQAG